MLLPLDWLKEYVNINISAEILAEKLLLSGTKVEEIKKEKLGTVLDLEITPNRPDTLSIYGVAREVSALLSEELKELDTQLLLNPKIPTQKVSFKIKDKKLCPFYSLVKLNDIKIEESPDWIKDYLTLAGIRPINNVVDITNFVMLETGQPMHAFDAAKITGSLSLRGAKEGERVKTLDGQERKVNEGAIIIEDEEKLIDLAGLMGGANTEIDQDTKSIILLVPIYNSVAIRKASIFTGLRTEASSRFEKNLDPNAHPLALDRAIKLLFENASGTYGSQITNFNYPTPREFIDFSTNLVEKILGITLNEEEIINLLSPLGFQIKESALRDGVLTISVPTYRQDVKIPEDILEEIGRVYGYNKFPKTLPSGTLPQQKELFDLDTEREVRNFLISAGFTETTGYSLVSREDLLNFGFNPDDCVKVAYPMSQEFEYLRPSLFINLIKALETNKNRSELAFFEVAKEFKKVKDPTTKLPTQKRAIGIVTTGNQNELKGVVEILVKNRLDNVNEILKTEAGFWGEHLELHSAGNKIAQIGNLSKNILSKYEFSKSTNWAWINFEAINKAKIRVKYKPLPKYPPIIEDLSLFLNEDISIVDLLNEIEKSDSLINETEVFDLFRKEGKKSVSIRIKYLNPERTLTNEEISKVRNKVYKNLQKKFKVEIREN